MHPYTQSAHLWRDEQEEGAVEGVPVICCLIIQRGIQLQRIQVVGAYISHGQALHVPQLVLRSQPTSSMQFYCTGMQCWHTMLSAWDQTVSWVSLAARSSMAGWWLDMRAGLGWGGSQGPTMPTEVVDGKRVSMFAKHASALPAAWLKPATHTGLPPSLLGYWCLSSAAGPLAGAFANPSMYSSSSSSSEKSALMYSVGFGEKTLYKFANTIFLK